MNTARQLGSQHVRSRRTTAGPPALEMGIRATITHPGIVLHRERAFGADDDVNCHKPARVQETSLLSDRLQLTGSALLMCSESDCQAVSSVADVHRPPFGIDLTDAQRQEIEHDIEFMEAAQGRRKGAHRKR